MNNLARVLRARGDIDGAEPYIRDALAMKRRLFPGDNAEVAISISGLGILLVSRGELPEAETLLRESLEMNRRLFPGDHASVAADLNNVAFVLMARGDAAGAEEFARESVAMLERLDGKDAFSTANARLKLGQALASLSRFAAAEVELLETERVFSATASVPPAKQKQCLSELQKLYEAWDVAEPGQGHDASAAIWNAKLRQ